MPGQSKLVLREFNWSGLVAERFFENVIIGVVGAGIGLILVESHDIPVPRWLFTSVAASSLCVVAAYVRVWKTIREEHETSRLWDEIVRRDEYENILDRVFELPYLFCITVMPLATIVPLAFMIVLLIFYLADNYYNSSLARGVALLDAEVRSAGATPVPDSSASRSYWGALATALRRSVWMSARDIVASAHPLVAYFRTRSRYNSALVAVLGIAIVVSAMTAADSRATAVTTSFIAVVAVLIVEALIEPRRNLGMAFESDPADEDDD